MTLIFLDCKGVDYNEKIKTVPFLVWCYIEYDI